MFSHADYPCTSDNLFQSHENTLASQNASADCIHFRTVAIDNETTPLRHHPSLTFSVEEFLLDLDLDILRIIFFSLDLLLLFYRLTHMYLCVRSMCLGFEAVIPVYRQAEDFKNQPEALPLNCPYDNPYGRTSDIQPSHSGPASTKSSKRHPKKLANHNPAESKHKPNGDAVRLRESMAETNEGSLDEDGRATEAEDDNQTFQKTSTFSETLRQWLLALRDTTLIPRTVFAVVILLSLTVICSVTNSAFSMDTLSAVISYMPIHSTLHVQVQTANQFLVAMATQATESWSLWYNRHMTTEMMQLERIRHYFNEGQFGIVNISLYQ